MSEGEATATLEESTVAESEKVKAINGMKEVEEVKLQNGESEKPQINGDMEKGEELDSGDQQNGREEGGFEEDTPKQKFSVPVERTLDASEEEEEVMEKEEEHVDGGKNGEKMEVEEEQKDGGDGAEEGSDKVEEEEEEDESDSAVGEGRDTVEKEEEEPDESVVEKADKSEEQEEEEKKGDDDEEEDKSSDSDKNISENKSDDKSKEEEKKEESSEEKKATDNLDKKKEEAEKTPTKDKKSSESNNNNNSTTKTKESGKKSKNTDEIQEIPVTRQLRARKTPKKYTEDDDDIKITNEVIRDDSSDIEMIEESDPLAISDADVKKIQKEKKEVTIKVKDPNVIIIDTNTLLKNQGNLAAAVAQSNTTGSSVQTIHPRSTSSSSNTVSNMSIQNAIQAITGGVPAQGLQSAYITALQQVLLSQGGQVPMNTQHLAQLQQYYNSLGHLQDDAYVIEAPSFIVPYVMEGKPKEPIKDFLKRINKDLEEFDKKGKEEEDKKKRDNERLERRRKREEERQKRLAAGEEVGEQRDTDDEEEKEKLKKKEEDEVKKKEKDEKDQDKKDKDEDEDDDDDEKMEVDEDREKDDTEAETKDKERKEDDDEEDKEKSAEVETEKKEEKESKKETKEGETDDAKSDKEDKEEDNEDEERDAKKEEEAKAKEKDTKAEDKEKKDESEAADDDDKENKEKEKEKDSKDKSDTDSVVDLEKEVKKGEDLSYLGKWEPYYKSALGKFMMELGLNQAQEFLQSDLLRMQKRKLDKMKTQPSREGIMGVRLLEKQLEVTRKKNSHLAVPLKICKFCTFKTESEMVMERHLESPHMVNYTYKCNFCDFETRGPQIILFHMEAEHNVRGRLERAPAFFQCSLCPYEDNNKSKMTRHSFSCAKKYKPERNCELLDWEPPAKIPKIHRGRPNVLGKAFEPVKMPNLLPKNLTGMNINLQGTNIISQSQSAAALAAARGRGRPVGSYKNVVPMSNQGRGVNTVNSGSLLYTNRGTGTTTSIQGSGSQQFTLGNQMFHLVNGHLVPMSSGSGSSVSSVSISSQSGGRVQRILPSSNTTTSSSSTNPVSLIPGLGASSSITIQSVQSKGGNTKSPQQPSISITPLPRGGQQPSQGGGGKGSSSQSRGGDSGGKPSFVICEICDGYIKDLEQLRNHMNLIHKVKIHPKMIYNRPPLNCQKCQHRFFTDQGLERHLLGTHGLVTSSMQEAANKGKDAGRCPICGKVFQWKLLNHVSRDHKMTLKPAHLSYKCTVCTATFNMYRLFENHVYSAHSVVNKNKGEGGKKGGGSSDSPLKINDEITIIPQPAVGKTKSSSSSSGSEKTTLSKKSEGTPTMSKEITITKVGSRPTRRSGGSSVEVISLDESPKKSSNSCSPGSADTKKRANKDSLGNSSKKSKTSS